MVVERNPYEEPLGFLGFGLYRCGALCGLGGALTETNTGDWFTAATYRDWSRYNEQEKMTTYLLITVDGAQGSGEVISPGVDTGPVNAALLKVGADAEQMPNKME